MAMAPSDFTLQSSVAGPVTLILQRPNIRWPGLLLCTKRPSG